MKKCSICKLEKDFEEFHRNRGRIDGRTHECKKCVSEKNTRKYRSDPEAGRIRVREQYKVYGERRRKVANDYYYANKDTILPKQLERQKERMKTDPKYRLSRRLRNRLWYALQKKSWKKNTKFSAYIGCTLNELKTHLERQFLPGMTWENMGEWHVDHIVPLNSAKTEEEMYKLCHYSNLCPLWAEDNLSKGSRVA